MNTAAKGLLAVIMLGASAAAVAQVYDLNFKLSGEHITGSITVGGNLSGSSLFCNGGGGCGLTVNGSTLQFDFGSSSVFEDIFNCQNPGYCGFLSMNSAGVYGSGNGAVTFDVNGQGSGQWDAPAGLTDLTLSATAAPEIDSGTTATGLAFLAGVLLVLRGRRRHNLAH